MIVILVHIFYPLSWKSFLRAKILAIKEHDPILLINLCDDTPGWEEIISSIKKDFPGAFILRTPNIGKDIGGKLALLDLLLNIQMQPELMLLIHDKFSPQSIAGDHWRNGLLKIIEPAVLLNVVDRFEKDKMLGIAGAKEFLIHSNDIRNSNKKNEEIIAILSNNYSLQMADHPFIGGTMFWARSKIFLDFFRKFPPLEARAMLEHGNVLDFSAGTYTHAWERIFCRIAVSNGFTIKGI